MTVALSILFAAVAGGLVFMLLDNWQRKHAEPVSSAPPIEPEPSLWTPEPTRWQPPSHEAATRPLAPWPPEQDTRPLPPRREPPPLWTPPPGSARRWDEDDRFRDDDDDENRPPGLWSGWANRR
jgi:hypothetical protein